MSAAEEVVRLRTQMEEMAAQQRHGRLVSTPLIPHQTFQDAAAGGGGGDGGGIRLF